MYKLKVIIASTRPGRLGLPIGEWFYNYTKKNDINFETELIDLLKINLPFLDEPNHPTLKNYQKEHTKDWSTMIEGSDAFVFIVPEYNFFPPATLINALDYLYKEWNYKAAGFVSYGGISGGMRSVQIIKQILTTLKMVPLYETVTITNVREHLDEEINFRSDPKLEKAASTMLNALHRWTDALVQLRK
jgi:NAD(P)H-dependent FMN reductase